MNKTTIKQALTLFNISRSSLYNHMKKQGITPIKEKGRVHLLDNQIADLKRVIHTSCPNLDKQDKIDGQEKPEKNSKNSDEKQIKEIKAELKTEREENKKLVLQLGLWQGRAKTLEEQNQKLLLLQTPPTPPKVGFFQKIFGKK